MRTLTVALALTLTGPAAAGQSHHHPGDGDAARRDQQLDAVRRATARYHDVAVAERDGYRLMRRARDAPLMGEHWVNRDRMRAPLDLEHPAVLQYAKVGDRRVLVGVAYGRFQRPGEPMPEGFAGADDHWHTHDMEPLAQALAGRGAIRRRLVGRAITSGRVTGSADRTELAMLHAWVWSENPDGVFANHNRTLPYLRAGLPASAAGTQGGPRAVAAARGVALLAPGGCDRMGQGAAAYFDADRRQVAELARACREASARIGAARGAPERLNPVAAEEFGRFAATARGLMTPEQRVRAAELVRLVGETPEGH